MTVIFEIRTWTCLTSQKSKSTFHPILWKCETVVIISRQIIIHYHYMKRVKDQMFRKRNVNFTGFPKLLKHVDSWHRRSWASQDFWSMSWLLLSVFTRSDLEGQKCKTERATAVKLPKYTKKLWKSFSKYFCETDREKWTKVKVQKRRIKCHWQIFLHLSIPGVRK